MKNILCLYEDERAKDRAMGRYCGFTAVSGKVLYALECFGIMSRYKSANEPSKIILGVGFSKSQVRNTIYIKTLATSNPYTVMITPIEIDFSKRI